jgi:pimeloyl-ACP methyl ester carboxylesterase
MFSEEIHMIEEKMFDTGVVELHYAEVQNAGPPLTFLHGLPGIWQDFLPIIPPLSVRWHIYAVDWRGCGKSGRVPGSYVLEQYGEDFMAFLEKKIGKETILFGHSAGGLMSIWLTSRLPKKVRAIILGDSPIDVEPLKTYMRNEETMDYFTTLRSLAGRPMKEILSPLGNMRVPGIDPPITYRERPDITDVYLRFWAKEVSQLDPDVLEYHAEGRVEEFFKNIDVEGDLHNVSCPVLLLQANPSLGGMMSDEDVELATAILDDVSHVFLEKAGHDLGLNSWNVGPLLRIVTNFLESL